MTAQSANPPQGHLRYYEQHGISPVRYRVEDLGAHFERRDSLYRSLGLPPVAFRGTRVLEVAPGSGQNSLYVAACRPESFDLVEPNPAGVSDVRASYAAFDVPHTPPNLHVERFESFAPPEPYDIVICENWLGSLPHEVELMRKLAALVAPGGVLVMTIVPLSGFFANVMRRLLALRLVTPGASFEQQTQELVDVFGPHLATIPNMTRSHRDWVHDCMLNPHYLNVALPLDTIINAIGTQMETLATFPRFTSDWRWFKGLTGVQRDFNARTLTAYRENVHNFIDCRTVFAPRTAEQNAPLDAVFHELHRTALRWQAAATDGNTAELVSPMDEIGGLLADIATRLGDIDADLGAAVNELRTVWLSGALSGAEVRDLKQFASLFGRETIYASFTRPRDA